MYRRAFRYAAKRNKEAPTGAKPPYAVFNPHDTEEAPVAPSKELCRKLGRSKQTFVQTLSIDPGVVNCGFFIKRKWSNGDLEIIMLTKFDFTTVAGLPELGSETQIYIAVRKTLDEFLEHFLMCHYIVIESQLPINYDLVRMSQHLISYFSLRLENQGLLPLIIEFDPHYKTNLLGAPKFLGAKKDGTNPKKGRSERMKGERKDWCTQKAIALLDEYGYPDDAEMIRRSKKKDDLGDIVCQEAAWEIILEGGVKPPPKPVEEAELEMEFYIVRSGKGRK
jgi:hypothetical protein